MCLGWVSRFGSSVSGLGLGFLGFLGLRVFGWLGFWVRAERLGAWGFRVLGLAQGFGFRA